MMYKEFLEVEGNNKRAVFYAYLAYSKAISESNNDNRISVLAALSAKSSKSVLNPFDRLESPFEEEVYQVLASELGEDKLIPQLQFAGFRIDIVYDSKNPNVPKIAIECDGAKYHSSREAYLYDLHRQKILESHGFVFHRIWSTNWWRNAKRETNNLIEFIRKVESDEKYRISDYSNSSLAFNDEIEIIESYVSKKSTSNYDKEIVRIKTIENQVKQRTLFKDEIRLNSKVTVRYINSGEDIKVHIVDNTSHNEIVNGFQKINSKSPLAISILGHSVGDIVKVGNLDNFVEIKEIN